MEQRKPISEDFVWGVATAAHQVEGAAEQRGASIWDTFAKISGKVASGHNGDIACDQFHRYAEDIRLMHNLGIDSYRFSIAWPRIFPSSMTQQNPNGFDYYKRLIEKLLRHDIAPMLTLYHWDLPQYLQDNGGWGKRDTAYHFADYAETCFRALGDSVTQWITLNEPFCSAYLGHLWGIHAPGISHKETAYRAVHHLNLGHGLAVQGFRGGGYSGQIGITHNLSAVRPATRRKADILAADRAQDQGSRMFLDPQLKGQYPERFLSAEEITLPIQEGDMEIISAPIDFLGLNYYTEQAIAHDPYTPPHYTQELRAYQPLTDFGWPIVPEGLFRLLKWVKEEYGDIPLYITENGCAAPDKLSDCGQFCSDPMRVDYLRRHFAAMKRAVREEGVNLKGYYLWSLLDNFEWAEGYHKRFGIIYVDYENSQRRIPKDSYHYYREVIAGNEPL
ncbi:MAG: GH1 family beta-glucosidase [Spirochaetota bacterium]